jgi:hypothetical protein
LREAVVFIPFMVAQLCNLRHLRFWKQAFGNAKDKAHIAVPYL